MEDLPIYSVKFDPDDTTQGVYAVSLVSEPAIGLDFVALSENKPTQFKLSDTEKKIVTGPILIPNQKIYRNQGGKEFYLTFDESTVEKLSQQYLKRDFHKNSFYEHDESEKINLTMVESWITGENDKSKDLGFNLPKGTWFGSFKLSDKDWDEYVKSGKVLGFSIDSMLNFKEVKMNKIQKLVSQLVKMFKDVNSISVEGVEMYYEGELRDGTILTDSEGNPIQGSFEYEGKKYASDFTGRVLEVQDLTENKPEIMEEEMPIQPDAIAEVMDNIMEIVAVLEGAGMEVSALKQKLGMAPKQEAPMEEALMEDVPMEEALMEEAPKEDEMVEMKKRIQALEDKLKLAQDENMKLKKAPAATKLSAMQDDSRKPESTMSVIQKLAKLSQK